MLVLQIVVFGCWAGSSAWQHFGPMHKSLSKLEFIVTLVLFPLTAVVNAVMLVRRLNAPSDPAA